MWGAKSQRRSRKRYRRHGLDLGVSLLGVASLSDDSPKLIAGAERLVKETPQLA